jgi:SAM-dependent methyltransferase
MSHPEPPDQRDLWIAAYDHDPTLAGKTSRFIDDCLAVLPPTSRVLELGCGPGWDAAAMARAGHTVTAIDFAPNVIAANRERYSGIPNLTFIEGRIDSPYPFPNAAFDAVYAHLTLHYYRDAATRDIFTEIRRVLTPGGLLLFACKSPQDPAWGRGVEIEPDLFDLNGKVRHFFSEDYARSLLADGFTEIRTDSHTGKLYRQKAGWITAIARAT